MLEDMKVREDKDKSCSKSECPNPILSHFPYHWIFQIAFVELTYAILIMKCFPRFRIAIWRVDQSLNA